MNISGLMGLIAFLGFVLFVGGLVLAVSNASSKRSWRSGAVLALIGLLVGSVFFVFSSGVVQVESNEIAVVFQPFGGDPADGRLSRTPLGPGVHIIVPYLNVPTIYSTRLETYTMTAVVSEGRVRGDDSIKARTKDGQQIDLDVSIVYGVSTTQVNRLHVKWQNRYEDGFVRPTSREAIREAVSAYGVEEIYGEKRAELKNRIIEILKPRFEENGLTLSDALVRNITFSPEYIKAIEQRQVATQEAERAKLEAERARTVAKGEADAAVLRAKGESDALAARVQGEAEAIRIRAKAESDALGFISEQLNKNPLLIQYTYVQRLSEKVNLIMLPSNSPFLFDAQALMGGVKPTATPTP
jgi:regulator of protease activity HflC (stomatin/prohibitin superfamily)